MNFSMCLNEHDSAQVASTWSSGVKMSHIWSNKFGFGFNYILCIAAFSDRSTKGLQATHYTISL